MNGRELELAAIRHEVPDRIPTDAICVENTDEVASMLGIEPAAVPDALGICGRIVSLRCAPCPTAYARSIRQSRAIKRGGSLPDPKGASAESAETVSREMSGGRRAASNSSPGVRSSSVSIRSASAISCVRNAS